MILAFNQITQNNAEYGLKKLNVIKEINLQLKISPPGRLCGSKLAKHDGRQTTRRTGVKVTDGKGKARDNAGEDLI